MQNEWGVRKCVTGQACLMIPDLAIAMLSKEPPSAAKCSSPIVVITEAKSSGAENTFVASRAPPRPTYHKY